MIDIHSHVIFGVDDGAKTLEDSLALLKESKKQGVDCVYATPHFYTMDSDIETYKEKVNKNFNELKSNAQGEEYPEIYLGCELHYFRGIHKSQNLRDFALEGTDFILIELDHTEFTKKILDDIEDIPWYSGLKPILAHIERYSKCKGFDKLLKLIDHENIFSQITANSLFDNDYHKKTAIKLLKKGYVDFIASDMHNIKKRPPKMELAYKSLQKEIGVNKAEQFFSNSQNIMKK